MNIRMLIVDDDDDARLLARSIVEEFIPCATIAECSSGQEALQQLRNASQPPDVVLLDVNMPRLTGPQMLKVITDEPALAHRVAHTVFFLISNWETERLHQWLLTSDIKTLDKPFGPSDVLTVLKATQKLPSGTQTPGHHESR